MRDIAFNQADTIICIKVDHTGTVSTSISSTSIAIRGDASGNWYWVILNEQANTFNLYSYNGGTFTEMAKYRKLTGITHLTVHSTRHTFGHELVVRKVPLDGSGTAIGQLRNCLGYNE